MVMESNLGMMVQNMKGIILMAKSRVKEFIHGINQIIFFIIMNLIYKNYK